MESVIVDLAIGTIAVTTAIARRPWRAIAATGPPWAWVLVSALLPLWWSIDHQLGVAVLPPLSGAALLVLMAGWPLAVLLCVPIALITVFGGPLDAYDALHRAVWLGIVPATVALAVGGVVRRCALARWRLCVCPWVYRVRCRCMAGRRARCCAGCRTGDCRAGIARLLMALGEATITGAVVTLLVAHRPEALATYSDRLYLAE